MEQGNSKSFTAAHNYKKANKIIPKSRKIIITLIKLRFSESELVHVVLDARP